MVISVRDIEKDPNQFKGINNGWPVIMSTLKSLREIGEPITYAPCPSAR